MDAIKEDIHQELHRLRLDKRHLYTTLLKIIDTIPQGAAEPVVEPEPEPVAEPEPEPEPEPVVEPEPEPTPAPVVAPPVKKSTGRKKKSVTVQA